jgi:hypothetical protein
VDASVLPDFWVVFLLLFLAFVPFFALLFSALGASVFALSPAVESGLDLAGATGCAGASGAGPGCAMAVRVEAVKTAAIRADIILFIDMILYG